MKRWFAILACALTLGYAVTACGGGSDAGTAYKLTIVGSGN